MSSVNQCINDFKQEYSQTQHKIELIIKDIELQVALEMQDEVDK